MSNVNVGIIGYGLSGRVFHAPVIRSVEGFTITAIMTTNPAAMAAIRETDPAVRIAASPEEILESPGIDLVVISVPNTLHYSLARRALELGKHVVVEKPFTITWEEAEELAALAERSGRVLSVYHNRRWDGDFRTVQKIIQGKMLGNLVEFESHFDRFRPVLKANSWREEELPGSGLLYDLGSHLIDQALTLFGMPERVFADLRVQRVTGKVVDSWELILYYPGLKVTLKSGSLVREPIPRFMLQGDKGSFVKFGLDVQEDALKAGYMPHARPDWGLEAEAAYGILHTELEGVVVRGVVTTLPGDYREYYRGIHRAITQEEAPPVTARQAADVMRIIAAAAESAEKGRVITL